VRIVLFRPGALGDALLALPALALLGAVAPRPHVTLVARADVLPLARGAGLAEDARDFDLPCWSALWQAGARPRPPAALVLRGADAAIAWCADDGTLARNLAACGIPRVIVTPGRSPASASGTPHTALHLARTLGPLLPGEPPATLAALPSIAAALARAEDATAAEAALARLGVPPRRIVALHPGSGGAAKRWPAAAYAAIARRLLAAGHAPLLLAGPADEAAISAMRAALGADAARVPVARDLPLPALLGVLRRAAAYLGNDSGVSHLAGLAGVPALALFGPTDPAIWAPVGPRVRVIAAPSPAMAALPVEAVWVALRAMIEAAAR
jgi:ADP-heptose:LPS heptosyltransferase